MTLVIGVGQGGSNLADEMLRVPNGKELIDVMLFNSTLRDLGHVKDVPRSEWFGITDKGGLLRIDSVEGPAEDVLPSGFGKDPRHCFATMTTALDEIVAFLGNSEQVKRTLTTETFAVIAFSGAGGTGAGAAPVIARALKQLTEGRMRLLGVVILPAASRGDEGSSVARDAWNCAFSVGEALKVFDGLVVVDNERISHAGDLERAFPRYNEYVARCLTDLVLGNLTELEVPEAGEVIVQQSDIADILTALSIGAGATRRPGVAGIGRAVSMLQSPLQYLLPFLPLRPADFGSLGQLARDHMTLNAEGLVCEKGYMLVRAPTRVLSRLGSGHDVTDTIKELGKTTRLGEVVYGTALTRRPLASVTVGMTYDPATHPRLLEIQKAARDYDHGSGAS